MKVRAIVFDYGGVLAEEGFRQGLYAVAKSARLDPDVLHAEATAAMYESGYILGKAKEADFWKNLRQKVSVPVADSVLRQEILARFQLRPEMVALVRRLKEEGYRIAILSDQSDWLDELETRDSFFHLFDLVWNSFHQGKSKRDKTIFFDLAEELGVSEKEILFIDDHNNHLKRACDAGMQTHLYVDHGGLLTALKREGIL